MLHLPRKINMRKVTYPQEIEVWFLLPAIRKMIAFELIKKGKSQKEVAKIMGVTEASISHYKRSKRATIDILDTPQIQDQILKATEKVIEDNSCLTLEVLRINQLLKESGFLCKIYKANTLLCDKDWPCNSCDGDCKGATNDLSKCSD